MHPFSTTSGTGGHPRGGPLRFSRSLGVRGRPPAAALRPLSLLLLALALPACIGRGGADRARPGEGGAFSRPLEIYDELGFMTGSGAFPIVASFATLAGPGDSTQVLLGMSLPNSALRYQREGSGFEAEYEVSLTFMSLDSVVVSRAGERATVRVPAFPETGRTDESIVYQQAFTMAPGDYIVQLDVADVNSSRGFRGRDTLAVPAYGTVAHLSAPVFVYEASGRSARSETPALIINPRHTVPYGGEAPLLYVEAYGPDREALDVRVLNEQRDTVWEESVPLRSTGPGLQYAIIEVPTEVLPLGRFALEIDGGAGEVASAPLVMTISDQWMVANFDDVLQFLRYVAHPQEIDSLRAGSPAERREAWERFWARRDPLPITELNEYRDAFFQRVRYATEAFREPGGRPGWNTDRGEVYIVLGPPDHAMERYVGNPDMMARPNAEEWIYSAVPGGRLDLLFVDRTGFGRFELVPAAAAAFRSVAERMKPRLPRD